MIDAEHEYLTAEEVAQLLRVSVKSVSRWAINDKSMPVLRIGGRVRFPRERLLAWLRSREQGHGRTNGTTRLREPLPVATEPIDRQQEPLADAGPCAYS